MIILDTLPPHLIVTSAGNQTQDLIPSTLYNVQWLSFWVRWTFNFPDDLSFNLPLTKHLLAVISKKYVWDCQIFDIWMIKASIVDVMWCGVTAVIAYLSKGCTVGNLPVQCTYTAHQLVSCCVHIPSDIVKLIII